MTDTDTRPTLPHPAIVVLQARADELYRQADTLEEAAPDGLRPARAQALYRQADLLVKAIEVLRAAEDLTPEFDPDLERASRISELREEIAAHRRRAHNLSRMVMESNRIVEDCERELEAELKAEREAARRVPCQYPECRSPAHTTEQHDARIDRTDSLCEP